MSSQTIRAAEARTTQQVIAQIVAGEKTQTEVARDERISKPSVSRMMKKFYEKEQKKLGLDVKLTLKRFCNLFKGAIP